MDPFFAYFVQRDQNETALMHSGVGKTQRACFDYSAPRKEEVQVHSPRSPVDLSNATQVLFQCKKFGKHIRGLNSASTDHYPIDKVILRYWTDGRSLIPRTRAKFRPRKGLSYYSLTTLSVDCLIATDRILSKTLALSLLDTTHSSRPLPELALFANRRRIMKRSFHVCDG